MIMADVNYVNLQSRSQEKMVIFVALEFVVKRLSLETVRPNK
jgi:hypothetical protein